MIFWKYFFSHKTNLPQMNPWRKILLKITVFCRNPQSIVETIFFLPCNRYLKKKLGRENISVGELWSPPKKCSKYWIDLVDYILDKDLLLLLYQWQIDQGVQPVRHSSFFSIFKLCASKCVFFQSPSRSETSEIEQASFIFAQNHFKIMQSRKVAPRG